MKLRRGRLSLVCAMTCLLGLASARAQPVGEIYWTQNDTGTIHRAGLDGSDQQVLIDVGSAFVGLAIDAAAGKMYWAENVNGKIGRANLDGTDATYIVENAVPVFHLALDLGADKIYWAGNKIWRADLDGSDRQAVHDPSGPGYLHGIGLDTAEEMMYWANWTSGTSGHIGKSRLDGSGAEIILNDNAYSLTVDADQGKLYVVDYFGNRIYSLNTDGSDQGDVVGVSSPRDVTIYQDKLYWTQAAGKIGRCNLDGSDVEILMDLGGGRDPTGIQVIPEPATLLIVTAAGLPMLLKRRRNA